MNGLNNEIETFKRYCETLNKKAEFIKVIDEFNEDADNDYEELVFNVDEKEVIIKCKFYTYEKIYEENPFIMFLNVDMWIDALIKFECRKITKKEIISEGCCVCFDDYKNDKKILGCGHSLCEVCLQQIKNKCPLCRCDNLEFMHKYIKTHAEDYKYKSFDGDVEDEMDKQDYILKEHERRHEILLKLNEEIDYKNFYKKMLYELRCDRIDFFIENMLTARSFNSTVKTKEGYFFFDDGEDEEEFKDEEKEE